MRKTGDILFYVLAFLFVFLGLVFNFYKYRQVLNIKREYKALLLNATGYLPYSFTDNKGIKILKDSILSNGVSLISTLSPHDCPVCLEREIRFLKVLHKEVPALPIIIIVSYYPSKGEIEPWLREWGLDFPYYFDPENTLEKMNGLRPSEAWNILVKKGQVITSFLPEENYFYKRAIFEFLHEYLKKIK